MKKSKQIKLKKAGWRVGDAKEFLGLSDEEIALIEVKRALIQLVRETREDESMTQDALAKLLNSSQSRMAKLENGSFDVSLDLIVRALFAMGVTSKELGRTISGL